MKALLVGSAVLVLAACTKMKSETSADTLVAQPAASATPPDTGMKMPAGAHMGDTDKSVAGTGVPAGYTGVTDDAGSKIDGAKYTSAGGKWEIQTGPAHITFAAKDTASGVYAANATFEQLEKPKHPEAFGVFIGGTDLTDPAKQKYSYFVVRGTGEYLVKVRNGANTTSVIDWTASPNVPKEDASGKATYKFTVHVAADTVHFAMDGKLVVAIPKSKLPTVGMAGIRVNHNLHLAVTPLSIDK